MSKNKEYNGILRTIQQIIETKAKPCTIEQVIREYHTQNPKSMPYEALGYNSERDLLQNAKIFQISKIKGKTYIQMAAEKNKSSGSETRLTRTSHSSRLSRDGSNDVLTVGDSIHKQELQLLDKFNRMSISAEPANKSLRKTKSAFTKDGPNITKISSSAPMEVGKLTKNKTFNKSRSAMEKTASKEQTAIVKNRKTSSITLTYREAGGQQSAPNKKSNVNAQRRQRRNYGNGDGKIMVANGDGDDSNTDLHGASSLTSMKLVDRLKNSLKPELNFLEWHLINILHTKVAAHANGFNSERLPDWYANTFDKPIPSDWWSLVVKSDKFDIITVDNKVKLKARYDVDLSLRTDVNISKQVKTIDGNEDKLCKANSSNDGSVISSSRSCESLSLSEVSSQCSIMNEMKYDFK